MSKKVMFIFGTRPEAIKLYPVIQYFTIQHLYDVTVVSSGQQKEMLDQTIESLGLKVDLDLALMTKNQSLATLTSRLFIELEDTLLKLKPDYLFIHGDTTTSMVAGIVGKYNKVKIFHVEAGLRSNDIYSPWPEEMNRKINAVTSDYHLVPTEGAKKNLLLEGIGTERILITGNTGIDALRLILNTQKNNPNETEMISSKLLNDSGRIVLITIHRRENFDKLKGIFSALKTLAIQNTSWKFIYPVHLNPNVQSLADQLLTGIENLSLVEPLQYSEFIILLKVASFVITDSGGIQEEATYLGKPVLLCRNTTERPEGLTTQNIILAGTDKESIVDFGTKLITDKDYYNKHAVPSEVFGDGYASQKIFDFVSSIKNE
jgi:UDP-N-acetylglucosamine 2-epimerase (non-hydrolysing)